MMLFSSLFKNVSPFLIHLMVNLIIYFIFYLQYCNGGDLADYLGGKHSCVQSPLLHFGVSSEDFNIITEFIFFIAVMGTLSEDTIRLFLCQLGKGCFL
jgi:hypothetical protein